MASNNSLPLLDFYCYKPGCLNNGGRCTGIRLVPEPSLPIEPSLNAPHVPIRVLRGITKHIRQSVADQLHRPNDPGLNDGVISRDIDFTREAHRREMRKGGTYV